MILRLGQVPAPSVRFNLLVLERGARSAVLCFKVQAYGLASQASFDRVDRKLSRDCPSTTKVATAARLINEIGRNFGLGIGTLQNQIESWIFT